MKTDIQNVKKDKMFDILKNEKNHNNENEEFIEYALKKIQKNREHNNKDAQ